MAAGIHIETQSLWSIARDVLKDYSGPGDEEKAMAAFEGAVLVADGIQRVTPLVREAIRLAGQQILIQLRHAANAVVMDLRDHAAFANESPPTDLRAREHPKPYPPPTIVPPKREEPREATIMRREWEYLLDSELPGPRDNVGGIRLRDANMSQCLEASKFCGIRGNNLKLKERWYRFIADGLTSETERVGERYKESQLLALEKKAAVDLHITNELLK